MKSLTTTICAMVFGLSAIALQANPLDRNYHEQEPFLKSAHQHMPGGEHPEYIPEYIPEPVFEHHHPRPHQIIVTKKDYNFEEDFDIDSDMGHLGNVVQSSFSLRKNYSYYNHHGDLVSSAYVRMMSFGSLMNSATVMDVYDASGTQVGLIEGTLIFTMAPAKFYFYDAHGEVRGIAYLDNDKCSYTVYHPHHNQKIIASFNRVFIRDAQDYWIIDVIDPEAIDPRLLVSFGAFAVDTQATFRPDY